jgi:hypothetical protein
MAVAEYQVNLLSMTSILQAVAPAMPLTLISASRLLLTEGPSVMDNESTSATWTKNLTRRAALVTPSLKEIPGYPHGGINE